MKKLILILMLLLLPASAWAWGTMVVGGGVPVSGCNTAWHSDDWSGAAVDTEWDSKSDGDTKLSLDSGTLKVTETSTTDSYVAINDSGSIPASVNEYTSYVEFKISSTSNFAASTSGVIMQYSVGGTTAKIRLRTDASGSLTGFYNYTYNGSCGAVATYTISADTYYDLWMYWKKDAVDGHWEVWIRQGTGAWTDVTGSDCTSIDTSAGGSLGYVVVGNIGDSLYSSTTYSVNYANWSIKTGYCARSNY